MSDKQRWPRSVALSVAEELAADLAPFCERIAIAGSLRRETPDVGDIELVCIPLPADETTLRADMLDHRLWQHLSGGLLAKRKKEGGGFIGYGPDNKFLVHTPSGIGIDIFTLTAPNWGMGLLVRTGGADFNKRVMSRFQEMGYAGHVLKGVSNRKGEHIDCPDEEGVFRLLGWRYIDPEGRS